MEINWAIEDGYWDPESRPQSVEVDLEEFKDMTDEEIEEELYAIIQEEFEANMAPFVIGMERTLEEIKEGLKNG